jgi:hypothetical protein
MSSAIFNIVMGALAIAGALSGRLKLPLTEGPTPLLIVGIAICGLGIYQAVQAKRSR